MGSYKKSMVLRAETTARLIGGLTIAAYLFGSLLAQNNVWIFDIGECSQGSKECSDRSFCNLEFRGIKGNCESCEDKWGAFRDCAKESFIHPSGNKECAAMCSSPIPEPDPSILGIPCTYGNIPQRDCSTNELCYLDWMSDTGHCAKCVDIESCDSYSAFQDLWFECA